MADATVLDYPISWRPLSATADKGNRLKGYLLSARVLPRLIGDLDSTRFAMPGTSLLDHFSALQDPRQAAKVGYRLPEILLVVLCGTMAGAENFVEIERSANRKLAFLRRLLPFGRGVPSHDTLNDVMNALPATLFSECFTAWVETLREAEPDIVAIDGQTSRRARAGATHPLHLVSAWACRQRLVLGQEAVDRKGNEITHGTAPGRSRSRTTAAPRASADAPAIGGPKIVRSGQHGGQRKPKDRPQPVVPALPAPPARNLSQSIPKRALHRQPPLAVRHQKPLHNSRHQPLHAVR